MNVYSYGPHALLAEVGSTEQAERLRARLEEAPPPGVVETMPGIRTVLVRFDPAGTDARTLADRLVRAEDALRTGPGAPTEESGPRAVVVRVRYDGEDLDHVAAHTGLTREEVAAAHLAAHYRVALIGMAPGFYFLSGGDPRLSVPRRPSPRHRVPRGALGLAGPLTGIYPKEGPGGWQLIGTVLDDLWHPTRVPAALLAPGTVVRFAGP